MALRDSAAAAASSSSQQQPAAASSSQQQEAVHTIDWDQVRTGSDDDMSLLLSMVEDGMPDQKCKLPPKLRDYYQFREHLYSVNGVILYKDRIVIPPSLRQIVY